MKLEDKYVNVLDKDKPENKDKIVLGNDAFAVCEFLEQLKEAVNIFRINIKK